MSTTFPIEVTVPRLVEFAGTINAICLEEIGRVPSHTVGDAVGEIMLLMALNGETGADLQAWLHEQPEAIAHRSTPPLPAPLSRDAICRVNLTFQGLTVQTQQYGILPWFDAALFSLSPDDRRAVYVAKKAAGDTHAIIQYDANPGSIYDEPGQPYQQMNGPAFELDTPGFLAAIRELLIAGFTPMVFLGGDDGERGYLVADAQLAPLLQTLQGAERDFTQDVLIVPGWDGVFYGWTPDHIIAFGRKFRLLCPQGHLGIEHNPGHIPTGEGDFDWILGNDRMEHYDVLLSEFSNWPARGDQIWQIAARTLGPAYRRPADQPSDDDPHPPFYLRTGNQRGPYATCAFEFAEYEWVRNRISQEDVARARAYFRALGYGGTG